MSTITQPHDQQAARLTGRRRSSTLRTALDQLQSGRRRSSAVRRYAHNVENFNRNRAAEVGRRGSEAVPASPRTMRTRSMARVDEEISTAEQQNEEDTAEWQPSIAMGSPLWLEGEDPSIIEIADRKVAQTRLWADHYRGVARFAEMLEEAIQERAKLDASDEVNIQPRSTLATVHTKAINQRVDILQHILQDCQFEPERENIEAAISGYESGSIPYSDCYTIIWAGRIVDRMPDYETFANNREALLDRYTSEHGPGWLWYEAPLKGNSTITAKRGVTLHNVPAHRKGTQNTGHYTIRLGFQRRKELVTRGSSSSAYYSSSRKSNSGRVHTNPDPNASIVYFETLLDSGATHPVLFSNDLLCLEINPKTYAAQTVQTVHTAQGTTTSRSYEVTTFIFPFPEKTRTHPQIHYPTYNPPSYPQPPSPSSPPTWPTEPFVIQTLSPIIVFPGSSASDFDPSSTPDRLSGFAPFNALYLSSTPGQYKLHMGEDRRDVLGSTRMPGHIRYRNDVFLARKSIKGPQLLPGHPPWLASTSISETPRRIIFEHEFVDGTGRVVRDEDGDDEHGAGGRSVLVLGQKGTKFDELSPKGGGVNGQTVFVIEPRKLDSQKEALKEWEAKNKSGGAPATAGCRNG
ncbi:hypothetical protein QBC44DRAFT_362767 [Cladorrhinum sp. PSN332]|nr:hypothetical protein QBC44DRAFT_362767 [Cladorrhinum sp. PSN332]